MTTSTSTRRYTQSLITWLQLREVGGDRIGEIVAEVEAHVAESGEDAETAFGPARRYAAQFGSPPRRWGLNRSSITIAVVAAVGGWLLAGGFFTVVRGGGGDVVGLPGWLALALGLALLTAVVLRLPVNTVVDPRRPRRREHPKAVLLGIMALSYAAMLGLGWLLMALV